LGRTISPHPLIVAHLLGKEFGVPPHEVLEWEAQDFQRAALLMSDLQPKEK